MLRTTLMLAALSAPWVVPAAKTPAPTEPAPAAQGAAPLPSSASSDAPGFAASAFDTVVTFAELDELLLERRAMSEDGREALKHLVRARLLERLAKESHLSVSADELDGRVRAIEQQMNDQGSSLADYLEQNRVPAEVFREFLRLGIVQELLSRRALGIPEEESVPADQQEMWLDQIIEQRGSQLPAPPWTDGIAARCGDLEVSARDFVLHMRTQLPLDLVREDCYQLLLTKRMRARMPDLATETLTGAIAAELERRRRDVAGDPQFKGLTYEELTTAQGIQPSFLPRDPAVVAAALAQLWVERSSDADELLRVYQREREYFDGRYGEALDTRLIFLRAAVLTNQLIPRSFEAATEELTRAARDVHNAEQFEDLAKRISEDNATRELGGRLGFVSKGDERIPEEIRGALFPGGEAISGGSRTLGPLRIASGTLLLWVDARRPMPSWETMASHVHNDLRRRFMDEVLPRDAMHTFLDVN